MLAPLVDLPHRPAAHSPLDQFRSKPRRQRLHPLEKALLVIVSVHLIFLPWALGTMHLWSQLTSLGLAVLGFVVALLPRDYTEEFTSGPDFRLYTFPKLIRFPIFWTGLLLLAYITVQGLNPAWEYVVANGAWTMKPIEHIKWLPTGTKNPFALGGQWRVLIIYGSAWLTVCTVWIGFTRRKSLQALFTVIAANGAAVALFALIQRMAGNGQLFWVWRSPNDSFFGSFIYKNHAAAYLLLGLAGSCGLAAWFYLRGLRRMEKSNPSGLFVFLSALLAVSILVSYARGATLFMLVFLALATIGFVIVQWRQPNLLRKPIVSVVILIGLAFFVRTGLNALSAGEAWDRVKQLSSASEGSFRSRKLATEATWEMTKSHWITGSGAGSFQFIFPAYQQRYPEIFDKGGRQFWHHAHNDLVEIPAELGAVGGSVILVSAASLLLLLGRYFFWENPLSLITVIGLLIMAAHTWTDFLFACPAILVTWCMLWPATALWAELEERKKG